MDKLKMLFVDDRSKRIHAALNQYGEKYDVTIAPSVKEALRAISQTDFDVISLDHDLNGDDYQDSDDRTSGMEIIRFITEYGWPKAKVPSFIIHTSNAFAGQQMYNKLRHMGLTANTIPFSYDGAAYARGIVRKLST